MTARVALLVLVTGTFAALWSGDHPDRLAANDRPTKVLVGQSGVTRELGSLQSLELLRPRQTPAVATATEFAKCAASIPVPREILAGTYLIADQRGRTAIRIVTQAECSMQDVASRHDGTHHYFVEVGDNRWHYIRIEQIAADRTATSPTSSHSLND